MFTYGMRSGTRAATSSLREGLKTRGFATVLFDGFTGESSGVVMNAESVQEHIVSDFRIKSDEKSGRPIRCLVVGNSA